LFFIANHPQQLYCLRLIEFSIMADTVVSETVNLENEEPVVEQNEEPAVEQTTNGNHQPGQSEIRLKPTLPAIIFYRKIIRFLMFPDQIWRRRWRKLKLRKMTPSSQSRKKWRLTMELARRR
jgi:hypothetical protein